MIARPHTYRVLTLFVSFLLVYAPGVASALAAGPKAPDSPYRSAKYLGFGSDMVIADLEYVLAAGEPTLNQCIDLSTALMLRGRFDAAYGTLFLAHQLADTERKTAQVYCRQGLALTFQASMEKDIARRTALLSQALHTSQQALYHDPKNELVAAQVLAVAEISHDKLATVVAAEYLKALNVDGAGHQVTVTVTEVVVAIKIVILVVEAGRKIYLLVKDIQSRDPDEILPAVEEVLVKFNRALDMGVAR